MRVLSYVKARYEDGSFTGVSRFDHELRLALEELGVVSVAELPADLDPARDLVITDNHLSMRVPSSVKTIVVHHGCAKTHFDRDREWQTPDTSEIVNDQHKMFSLRNRVFVAPSRWVAGEFARICPEVKSYYLPHYVEPFGPARTQQKPTGRPVVIGDWRNYNKGAGVIGRVAQKMKDVEFRKLNFPPNQEARRQFYLEADLYLCLSLSEGAPYAVADAEACAMRIVTTDVGFVNEINVAALIPWQRRDDPDVVVSYVRKALKKLRTAPSFFAGESGSSWAYAWRRLIDSVWATGKPPVDIETISTPTIAGEKSPRPAIPCKKVAVSLAGGIGNSIFNLPLLKALKLMDKEVIAYVGTDSPTAELWKRCRYIDQVVTDAAKLPKVDLKLSGPWCADGFGPDLVTRWEDPKVHNKAEWDVILGLAAKLGWTGGRPDVSDWHLDIDSQAGRHREFDVIIVPGCKPEKLWERKRYPHMVEVASKLVERGYSVAWAGLPGDRPEHDGPLPGQDGFGGDPIDRLPFFLAKAHVVLGTDSGPAQLAASLGIPTVMVFTATSPMKGDPVGSRVTKLYRSLECSPCQSTARWKKCEDWICREIDPEVVFSATMHMINEALSC